MVVHWEKLNPKDEVEVIQKHWISDLDQYVLRHCYLPIIGPTSYALYEKLLGIIEPGTAKSLVYHHRDFIEQLVLSKEEYIKARRRLEAIGLLASYLDSDRMKSYYFLLAPLAPDKFFKDTMMSTLLMDRLGEVDYKRVKERFSYTPDFDTEHLTNETASFQDVYHLPSQIYSLTTEDDSSLIGENNHRLDATLETPRFDWKFFFDLMSKVYFDDKVITSDVKKMVKTLHIMYGYDEIEISRLLQMSYYSRTNQISLEKLQENAIRQAQESDRVSIQNNMENQPISQETSSAQQSDLSEMEKQIANQARQYSPIDFIRSIKKQFQMRVTNDEAKLIHTLVEETSLTPPVINLLIHTYLVQMNNSSLNTKWIETTANDWSKAKINTPEEAIRYVKNRKQRQKAEREKRQQAKPWTNKKHYVEKKPDWFDQTDSQNTSNQENKQTEDETDFSLDDMENYKKLLERGDE